MQQLVIANACNLLDDTEVQAVIRPLQTQIDRDFLPQWKGKAIPVKLSAAPAAAIPRIAKKAWVIYLNKHSNDAGALGWHDDQASRVHGRVFVGDCMTFDLDWRVTLSHEVLEMILDPDVCRAWRMPNGRYASLEACDAVEADALGYAIDGTPVSDFVLPAYFGTGPGPYDFHNHLKGPCPALTPGGYMSVTDASGRWTQIQAEGEGLAGRRALLQGHRRRARAERPELVEAQ